MSLQTKIYALSERPEFGNEEHIKSLRLGQIHGRLLAKKYNPRKAQSHECNCDHCDFHGVYCPVCECDQFYVLKGEVIIDGRMFDQSRRGAKVQVTRKFCKDCEVEVSF